MAKASSIVLTVKRGEERMRGRYFMLLHMLEWFGDNMRGSVDSYPSSRFIALALKSLGSAWYNGTPDTIVLPGNYFQHVDASDDISALCPTGSVRKWLQDVTLPQFPDQRSIFEQRNRRK